MPRFDKRHAFAAMAPGNARKYQMTQKAPKEQIPQLLAELVNRQANLKTIEIIQTFLSTVHVAGRDPAANLHRCFSWLEGVSQGESARVDEIKKLLPEENTEIKLGEPPAGPAQAGGAPSEAPAVSMGGVELEKGSPVLGPA